MQEAEQALSLPCVRSAPEAVAHEGVGSRPPLSMPRAVDERTRHAQRSAQYGPRPPSGWPWLDREQGDWNARLTNTSRPWPARNQPGTPAALCAQLFSPEEQLRLMPHWLRVLLPANTAAASTVLISSAATLMQRK